MFKLFKSFRDLQIAWLILSEGKKYSLYLNYTLLFLINLNEDNFNIEYHLINVFIAILEAINEW